MHSLPQLAQRVIVIFFSASFAASICFLAAVHVSIGCSFQVALSVCQSYVCALGLYAACLLC